MPPTASRDPQGLHDLLRILDVASTLRRERERAAMELDLDETKRRLRDRLRAAAVESGDPVTDAEIEVAIDQYYGGRHAFRAPKRGWKTLAAHLWIRRTAILGSAGVLLLGAALVHFLVLGDGAPFSSSRRATNRTEAAWTAFQEAHRYLEALSPDDQTRATAARIVAEAEAARTRLGSAAITAAATRLTTLAHDLDSERKAAARDAERQRDPGPQPRQRSPRSTRSPRRRPRRTRRDGFARKPRRSVTPRTGPSSSASSRTSSRCAPGCWRITKSASSVARVSGAGSTRTSRTAAASACPATT